MAFMKLFRRNLCKGAGLRVLLFGLTIAWVGIDAAAAAAQTKKPHAARRPPLTQADVQKLWTAKDDALLTNEITLRGLAFLPSGYWLDVELPGATSIAAPNLPGAAAALHHLIPTPPDLDEVAAKAPALLDSLKAAAQKHDETAMQPLVNPSLMANKAVIYDLFDPTNFRASTLGKPAMDEHGDVGLAYFELTTSNVEKLYYLLLGQQKGNLVVLDLMTGPSVANMYLHDEQTLANTKLETMFRALDDGDQSGLQQLCTPGLYKAIEDWGGKRHPGDRLSNGHQFSQVTAQSSIAMDQKSIRVVTRISYPLTSSDVLTFFIDFERIGNELKIVRLRDSDNKAIVYDPNIDNYLNERYGLPDAPVPDPRDVAMTEQIPFLNADDLRAKALRVLQYHDVQQIESIARFVGSDATSGEGYGLRAAADLLEGKYEDADKDAARALELNGTVYFVVERNQFMTATPFTAVVLGISKSKIEYLPAPGLGSRETIELSSVQKVEFEKGKGLGSMVRLSDARPFLKLEFKGSDGKKKTYNFADFGTKCPNDNVRPQVNNLIEVPGDVVCGTTSPNGTVAAAQGIPLLAPPTWHEDLTVVLQTVNQARGVNN